MARRLFHFPFTFSPSWATSDTATIGLGKALLRIAHEAPAPIGQKAKPAADSRACEAAEGLAADPGRRLSAGGPVQLFPNHLLA